jgi:hypothetical protein
MGRADIRPLRWHRRLEDVWAELFAAFRDCGYVRRPAPGRAAAEDEWEVRFLLRTAVQGDDLGNLLRKAGYPCGPPVRRRGKWQLSAFGRVTVEAVRELWAHFAPPGPPG